MVTRLVYRAYGVLKTPLDRLSNLLGFDIPATPLIDLASIKADGAIIHWTLPEKQRQKKEHKYAVYLNGAIIGNVSVYESAVTIIGLQPGVYYIVRVALVNSHEFISKSAPIRFYTKPSSSQDHFVAAQDGQDTDTDGAQEPVPRVRPYRGLKGITPASPGAAPMAREGSSGLAPRRVSGRRTSPASLWLGDKHDPQPDDNEAPEGAESIQQLTEKLDAIRRETEEVERQNREEEEEDTKQKEELIKERDDLRAQLNEKDKASRNLRKEVGQAERANTAAQNERTKLEKALAQKIQDRQKLKDDVSRWERETASMKEDIQRIREEKERYLEEFATKKEALRAKLDEETSAIKAIDDEAKEKASEIKKLERALKNNSPDGTSSEHNLVQQMQAEADEDRQWQARRTQLHQQYITSMNKYEASRRFHGEQVRYLESLRAERRRQEDMMQYVHSPIQQERLPRRADSQRSRHTPSRHSTSDSPRMSAFPPVSQGPFTENMAAFTPFLNISNGMTLANPTEEVAMSDEDREKLTGGAMMSPGAGADLLPADLFHDDSNRPQHVKPLPGLGALPGLGSMPAPPAASSSHDQAGPGPASPASVSSRSPSLFASPQASQHNLHIGSPEGVMDSDRRSIRSTRSQRAPSGGTSSRFSGMFGIKQRSKNLSDDGPPLSKASSMPRQDQGLMGLDSATRKRTSSISGTVFQSPNDALDGTSEAPAAPGTSRRGFAFFSREKSGGWPSTFTAFGRRPTSPRPGSTHSNELPRPSVDSSRWGIEGWPSGEAAAGARNSPLAFGPGWQPPNQQQSRLYGSRHPSRRPSVQYGATGPPEDIMEDDDSDALSADQVSMQAPIGTRPTAGSKRANTSDSSISGSTPGAKLNPNAKNFTSFFSSMKFGKDKTPASSKDEASTPVASSSGTPWLGTDDDDQSPPNSRKSRDARSMTTTESSLLESGRTSSDLARTPSYSNASEGVSQGSPSLGGIPKETFMQKISRKSSSSKFTLPTFKRNSSRLDTLGLSATSAPRDGVVAEGAEDEEVGSVAGSGSGTGSGDMGMSASAGSLGKEGRGSTRSWSSVLKIGKSKRQDEAASSVGGEETGEEESGTEEEKV